MIESHSSQQPGPVHEAVRNGVRDVEPCRSLRWLLRQRAVILLVAGVAPLVTVGVFIWWIDRDPPLPSQVATQLQVVAQVGLAEHATVTATCTRTDDHDYRCRLRDSAGRYGYANVSYGVTTHREHTVRWGFPVAADGTVTTFFNPLWDVRTSVHESLSETGEALGRPDLLDAITCVPALPPLPMVQEGNDSNGFVQASAAQYDYRCATHPPVVAVTLSRDNGGHYDLSYRVDVP